MGSPGCPEHELLIQELGVVTSLEAELEATAYPIASRQ